MADTIPCDLCDGQGKLLCSRCGGSGEGRTHLCGGCHGTGEVDCDRCAGEGALDLLKDVGLIPEEEDDDV